MRSLDQPLIRVKIQRNIQKLQFTFISSFRHRALENKMCHFSSVFIPLVIREASFYISSLLNSGRKCREITVIVSLVVHASPQNKSKKLPHCLSKPLNNLDGAVKYNGTFSRSNNKF